MNNARSLEVRAEASGAFAVPGSDAVGSKTIAGSVWMIGATGAAKAVGFICQLALAWFLTKKDYGIYAIAISLSVMLTAFRDGGLPMVLEQKGREFERFSGPVFWMMLSINGATALLIGSLATPIADLYRIPELAGVIRLFACSVLLSVLPSVLTVRLAVDLRFRELGLIQIASASLRNILLLYFAWAGFGARSFLLPLLIVNFSDTLLLWLASRFSPWTKSANLALWPELFRSGRWVVLGTFAIGFGNNGAYFLLGKFLPSELVGVYFFAYQLVVQLGTLLADNVYQVLVPSFARMRDDLVRIRAATLRALSVVVLFGSAASMSIAAIYVPLERTLWQGKWSTAATAVYILAGVWPAAAGVSVLRALQMATGEFRQWGALTMFGAMASVGGTVIGAFIGRSPGSAAAGFAGGALLGAALSATVALSRIDLAPAKAIASLARPWVVLAVAATVSRLAGRLTPGSWFEIFLTVPIFLCLGIIGLRLFARDSLEAFMGFLQNAMRTTFSSAAVRKEPAAS